MNILAIRAIYIYEMTRFFRAFFQSFMSPIVSTSLYFVVFGAAIGSRVGTIDNVSYGAYIVPGLIMLNIMTQSTSFASFGIYLPKFMGTIFEVLSAPINYYEIITGYVGAAATKSFIISLMVLVTAHLFVDMKIHYPLLMVLFLILTCISFSLFGFIIGIWAKNFEQVQMIPLLVLTPLVFLGGSFYSISMLPPVWQTISMFNPVVYLISGFRWSFFGTADVNMGVSLIAIAIFTSSCLVIIALIFKTGYRIQS